MFSGPKFVLRHNGLLWANFWGQSVHGWSKANKGCRCQCKSGHSSPMQFSSVSEYFVELVTVWLHFRLLSVCVYVCSSLTGCSVCLPESVCLCCQRLDKSRVKSWLFRCRLPQFLQTDLYAEYSLVQCLLRRSAEQKRRTEIKFSSNQNVFGGGGTKLVPYSFYYLWLNEKQISDRLCRSKLLWNFCLSSLSVLSYMASLDFSSAGWTVVVKVQN